MCIRDRMKSDLKSGSFYVKLGKQRVWLFFTFNRKISISWILAVSYTHLDVYKRQVKYQKGNNITDFIDWNTYPAIIKPVDSTGQRGIYRINNYDDLVSFFPKVLEHSVSKTVIVRCV